jgi:hypothetical protein
MTSNRIKSAGKRRIWPKDPIQSNYCKEHNIWHKATGEEPPSLANPDKQQQAAAGKVLVFAVISGASASVIQAMAKRWTQKLEAKAGAR